MTQDDMLDANPTPMNRSFRVTVPNDEVAILIRQICERTGESMSGLAGRLLAISIYEEAERMCKPLVLASLIKKER